MSTLPTSTQQYIESRLLGKKKKKGHLDWKGESKISVHR